MMGPVDKLLDALTTYVTTQYKPKETIPPKFEELSQADINSIAKNIIIKKEGDNYICGTKSWYERIPGVSLLKYLFSGLKKEYKRTRFDAILDAVRPVLERKAEADQEKTHTNLRILLNTIVNARAKGLQRIEMPKKVTVPPKRQDELKTLGQAGVQALRGRSRERSVSPTSRQREDITKKPVRSQSVSSVRPSSVSQEESQPLAPSFASKKKVHERRKVEEAASSQAMLGSKESLKKKPAPPKGAPPLLSNVKPTSTTLVTKGVPHTPSIHHKGVALPFLKQMRETQKPRKKALPPPFTPAQQHEKEDALKAATSDAAYAFWQSDKKVLAAVEKSDHFCILTKREEEIVQKGSDNPREWNNIFSKLFVAMTHGNKVVKERAEQNLCQILQRAMNQKSVMLNPLQKMFTDEGLKDLIRLTHKTYAAAFDEIITAFGQADSGRYAPIVTLLTNIRQMPLSDPPKFAPTVRNQYDAIRSHLVDCFQGQTLDQVLAGTKLGAFNTEIAKFTSDWREAQKK